MRHLDEGQFHQQPLVLALLVIEVAVVRQLHGTEQELRVALLCLFLIFITYFLACLDQPNGLCVLADQQIAEVTRQSSDEVLSLETLRKDFVQRQHALRNLFFEEIVRQSEIVVVVEHVQVLDSLLIGDIAAAERCHLVEDAQCIAHTTICLLGNDV